MTPAPLPPTALGFAPAPGMGYAITDAEFAGIRQLVLQETGINLSSEKKAMVVGRLGPRLRHRNLVTFSEYHKVLNDSAEKDELQMAIDLITTNETSFFREPAHFEVLREFIQSLRPVPFPFRVWSAASSSGEEAYTLAMVLSECLGSADWTILGTDISTRVLERAQKALYPMERAATIPPELLRRYCLKGQGRHEGMFLMNRQIRDRVRFTQANLCQPLPQLGPFDVVFLRNVLIYFDAAQKRRVVASARTQLKPGGLLIVGHSESLAGISDGLTALRPTVYRVA
jgi:chemotaxis protein methyltransferase CheR